jgi:hypothetical protein
MSVRGVMMGTSEAKVIEAAIEWVEDIEDSPNIWANNTDVALINAVQELTGIKTWDIK